MIAAIMCWLKKSVSNGLTYFGRLKGAQSGSQAQK